MSGGDMGCFGPQSPSVQGHFSSCLCLSNPSPPIYVYKLHIDTITGTWQLGSGRKRKTAANSMTRLQYPNSMPVSNNLKILTFITFSVILQVNLKRPCPFWNDISQCGRRDCAVKPCQSVRTMYTFKTCYIFFQIIAIF